MSETVGNVVIGVTADIGPLIRETARAKNTLTGLHAVADRAGTGLGKLFNASTKVAASMYVLKNIFGGLTASLGAITTKAAAMGDAIGDNAKAAGMGATAFQEYRFAIKEAADMTDEDFASAMVKLNKSLGEAREGSKTAITAFEKIGISQASIANGSVNTEAALAAFVKKMEETKDPATAAAMAADLFGKSGASLGAALSGVPGQVGALVARARELGVVMGPEAVKAAGDFDAKMKELGTQFEATKMKIAEVLLPVLVDKLIPLLQETIIPAINSVITTIGEWVTAFDGLSPAVQTVVGAIVTGFAVGGPALLAISGVATALSLIFSGPAAPLVLLAAAITAGVVVWQTWGDEIKGAVSSVLGAIQSIIDLFATGIQAAKDFGAAIAGAFALSGDAVYTNPSGGADAGSGIGILGGGSGGMGDFPGGGTGGSNSSATGVAITDGIINGMSARMTERLPEVAAIMQQVTDTANSTFGVQSPSTVFAGIGEFIGQGLAQGIASTSGIVNAAVGAMGQGAVGSSNAMVSSILGSLDTLFAGSQKAGAALALVNMFVGMSQEIRKGTFGFASMLKVAAQGMTIVKGIKGAKSGGGAGVGSSGGGGAAAAPQQAVQTMNFHVSNDPFGFGERMIRQIATQMNEASRNGMNIRASVVS